MKRFLLGAAFFFLFCSFSFAVDCGAMFYHNQYSKNLCSSSILESGSIISLSEIDFIKELNYAEQEGTEGEGIVTACIGAFSSAVVGCIIEACDIAVKMVKKTEKRKGKELAKAIGDTAWKAATGGFVMGFVAPGTP